MKKEDREIRSLGLAIYIIWIENDCDDTSPEVNDQVREAYRICNEFKILFLDVLMEVKRLKGDY